MHVYIFPGMKTRLMTEQPREKPKNTYLSFSHVYVRHSPGKMSAISGSESSNLITMEHHIGIYSYSFPGNPGSNYGKCSGNTPLRIPRMNPGLRSDDSGPRLSIQKKVQRPDILRNTFRRISMDMHSTPEMRKKLFV